MADLSALSNEQLFQLAGLSGGGSSPSNDLSSLSNDELFQIAGIQPKNPLEVVGASAPLDESYSGRLKNNLASAVNTINPFADEGAAGLRAASGWLQDQFGVPRTHGSYEDELAAIRNTEKAYSAVHPYQSGASAVIGALASAPSLPSAIGSQATLGAKLGQAAIEGAGYGGYFGFGGGEGGLDQRAKGAAEGALLGEALGPAGVLVGEGLSSLGSKIGDSAESLARKSFGARQGDYAKTANRLGIITDVPEDQIGTFTKRTLNDFAESGVLGESRDPAKLYAAAREQESALEKKVGGIVLSYDEQVGAPVTPSFDNARQMIEQGRIPGDKIESFVKRLNKLEENIAENGKGSLSYIQQQKVALGKDWVPDDGVRNEFTRALYSDLQRTVEQAVPEVRDINGALRKYKVLMPILERGVAGDEAGNGIGKFVQGIRTSGGGGVPLIAGAITGHPLLGAATTAGMMALQSPRGYAAAANVLGRLGESLGNVAPGIEQLAVTTAPNLATQTGLGAEVGSLFQGQPEGYTNPSVSAAAPLQQQQAPTSLSAIQNSLGQSQTQPNEALKKISVDLPSSNSSSIFSAAQPESIFSVPAPILDAVKAVESSGNANAVGEKTKYGTAKGAYQLLDSTGQEYHDKLGIKEPYDPFNEPQARQIAAAYLADLIAEFGDLRTALTAYHTGPGNVKKGKIGPIGKRYADSIFAKVEA